MAGSIICGVDDSESAKGAARVARSLSSKLGLGLVFVRVVEDGAPKKEIGAVANDSSVFPAAPLRWTAVPVGSSSSAIRPTGSSPPRRPRTQR
jgi:hypothetical protein